MFLVHLLSSILMPFVAGMAVAYFLDPVADWLEEKKLSRGIATTVILLAFFILVGILLMALFPLLQRQIVELVAMVPGMAENIRNEALPWLERMIADLPADTLDNIRDAAKEFAGRAVKWVSDVVANIWSGGLAFFNMLSLLVITPVVAFYLLRDWDLITAKIDSWLPRDAAPTIRKQFAEIDQTLAAFVRGQSTVCLVLGLIYGAGLTVAGLKSGLLVGLGAGFISFIPYLGAASGLVVGLGIAIFQFSEWTPIFVVAAIFLTGQTLESYVLTPRLVGDRVGLHPVWIIFALLAGGAVFGFTGVLLAVPVAAVIGVLTRFAIARYLDSPLYRGNTGDP
ncbi:MAG: AI-2E family transporter [Rhodospirillaceae bacterium]|nr:AI-2E family transporter [Rhodospirillaceae bacterium]MBT6084574.1 AI-2E family transporter [Rhodospirillaceae bacterium]MBT6609159.1 AI-2E family transporter [Rhodospirillaceae bacterium]MBT6884619.1 AI-2E family transporter [Rhodospirillaceae bacterium]MBT7250384.1 AI-2E family transporter [Rhodospirillaceae bacterium]